MAKNEKKSKKENKHFLKDFKAEIKKVIWPSPKQLVNSTVAIIIMVLVVAVIVFALDVVFETFNKHVLTNMQEAVQSSTIDESTENSENEDSNSSSEEATAEGDAANETTETTTQSDNATEESANQENAQANE